MGTTKVLHCDSGVAGHAVGLEMAFLSGSSGAGAEVEVWEQWQLDVMVQGPRFLLQPQSCNCHQRVLLYRVNKRAQEVEIGRWEEQVFS